MAEKKFNVAVAGATGAVGKQMITCLEERNFPVKSIKFLASHRSASVSGGHSLLMLGLFSASRRRRRRWSRSIRTVKSSGDARSTTAVYSGWFSQPRQINGRKSSQPGAWCNSQ